MPEKAHALICQYKIDISVLGLYEHKEDAREAMQDEVNKQHGEYDMGLDDDQDSIDLGDTQYYILSSDFYESSDIE